MFVESWLGDDLSDACLLGPASDRFIAHRLDRATGPGGGVCAIVSSKFHHERIALPASYDPTPEMVVLTLSPTTDPHLIAIWYRPPSGSKETQTAYLRSSLSALRSIFRPNKPFSLLCDANFPRADFINLSGADPLSSEFMTFVIEAGLTECIRQPTRGNASLDLLLTNSPERWSSVAVSDSRFAADHCDVTAQLAAPRDRPSQTHARPIPRPNFRQAKWPDFASFLRAIDWDYIDQISGDCTELMSHILRVLDDGTERFVPLCAPKRAPLSLPARLRTMRRQRLTAFRSRNLSPAHRIRFTAIDRKFRCAVKRFFVAREAGLLGDARRGLFRHYRHQTSLPSAYPLPPLIVDGRPCSSDKQRADTFADTFASAYRNDDGSCPSFCHPPATSTLAHVDFDRHRIIRILKRLAPKLSSGVDGIPGLLLKKLAAELAYPLSLLFSRACYSGDIPDQFKALACTPVPKPGKDHSLAKNFRPINCASNICKAMELALNEQLCSFLETHDFLHESQFGFRKGRSTSGQLVTFVQSVKDLRADGSDVHVLWTDFSSAFDRPVHRLICAKLYHAGLRGTLLTWIERFVSGRFASVKVGACTSEPFQLSSGFAQGSPLSATLWTIYINDLLIGLSEFVCVGAYADDVRIWSIDSAMLQSASDFLDRWCSEWQVTLAPAKCVYAVMGTGQPSPPLLSGIPAPVLDQPAQRDLGVLIDPMLSFAPHVNAVVTKARGISARILRSFHSCDPRVLFAAFETYVRPHLDYGSVAFGGLAKPLIRRLESVQKDFSWRCMKRAGLKRVPYLERLAFFNTASIESRLKSADVIFCHAILKGYHSCPVIAAEPRASDRPNRHAPRALSARNARKSPRSRIARLYNSLPADFRSLSLAGFKPNAREFFSVQ